MREFICNHNYCIDSIINEAELLRLANYVTGGGTNTIRAVDIQEAFLIVGTDMTGEVGDYLVETIAGDLLIMSLIDFGNTFTEEE